MKQWTKEEALEKFHSKWWEGLSDRVVFETQLKQRILALSFSQFHELAEKVLKRGVWTHEFADSKMLLKELNGEDVGPTDPLSTWERLGR